MVPNNNALALTDFTSSGSFNHPTTHGPTESASNYSLLFEVAPMSATSSANPSDPVLDGNHMACATYTTPARNAQIRARHFVTSAATCNYYSQTCGHFRPIAPNVLQIAFVSRSKAFVAASAHVVIASMDCVHSLADWSAASA